MKSSSPLSPYSIPGEPRLTERERKALARKEHILETALKLFARQGFDGTSTKQIAQAAGVAEGLIFHYFPTKDDLLNSVMESRHSFVGELRKLLDGADQKSVHVVLRAVAEGWLATLQQEKEITSVLFGTAQTNPKVGMALKGLIAEGVSRLSAYLNARVIAGELRSDLPVQTSAHMFFSSLMIFFVANRDLSASEWAAKSTVFVNEMLSVWVAGAYP